MLNRGRGPTLFVLVWFVCFEAWARGDDSSAWDGADGSNHAEALQNGVAPHLPDALATCVWEVRLEIFLSI